MWKNKSRAARVIGAFVSVDNVSSILPKIEIQRTM
jgi:hypothetical protein